MAATKDRMINPDSERAHAKVSEIRGNHAVYVWQPKSNRPSSSGLLRQSNSAPCPPGQPSR